MKVGGIEHKVSAYADDLLFFERNPRISIPNLMKEFQRCGNMSNFHINIQKSVVLNLSKTERTYAAVRKSSLRWAELQLNYLGRY